MKLLIAAFLASSGTASTASQVFSTTSSSLLRAQTRSVITSHISGVRNLQLYKSYTPEQCTTLLTTMTSFDADATGGLNKDEYYEFLKALDAELGTSQTKDTESFSELHTVPKVSHKSLACYCTVLGGEEDCCVGDNAEVSLDVLTDEEKVASGEAEEYANEVCETVYWTMLEWEEDGATGTESTVGGETTVAAIGTTEGAETTEAAGSTEAAETTEAAGTTEAAETTGSTEAAGTTEAAESTEVAGTTEAAETTEAAGTTGSTETTGSSETTAATIGTTEAGSTAAAGGETTGAAETTESSGSTEAAGETTESSLVTVAPEGTITTPASDDEVVTTAAPSGNVTTTVATGETTPSTGELPVTTTPAPLVSDDGTMTFISVTTTIDFNSYGDAQPTEYDPSTYYDASEVSENTNNNGILEDMQIGFVGLALDVLDAIANSASDDTVEESDDVVGNSTNATGANETISDDIVLETSSTEAASDATATVAVEGKRLRGRVLSQFISSVRSLQDDSFFVGGNLTMEVEDVACPAGLAYAPEGAPCLTFTYIIVPPADSYNSTDILSTFATSMDEAINNGDLYAKVVEINPNTLVTGSGEPGSGTYDATTTTVDGSENEDQRDSEGGLSVGAIVGIVVAVLAVPIAWLVYKSLNKDDDDSTQPSAKPQSPPTSAATSPQPDSVNSDDVIAGTATRTNAAVALKTDSNTKLGFTYKIYPDRIVVASVKEGSIFEGTTLKEGNEIISVNGQEVKGMDQEAFRGVLTSLPEGNVTIFMNEIVPLTTLRISAIKPGPKSKLGFTYKFIGSKIFIENVKDDGIFSNTELKRGQEIFSVNSRRVEGMNKDQFRGLLQVIPQGKVYITVKDIVESSIMKIETNKPSPESKLGFMYKVLDDGILVAGVNDAGIFANTALNKGQEIVSLNGKNVQKMNKEAFRGYLGTIPVGTVTLIVVDKPKKWNKAGTLLICKAIKETDDTKLGFTYKVMKDGATIDSVGEYGIFGPTDLAPRQEIISVNGTPIAGKDRAEFRELLANLKAGEVTIVVADRSPKYETNGEVLVVEANKETDATKLGFTYKIFQNKVLVEAVKPESIFGETELTKGQEILSINGTPVRGMNKDQFRDVLAGLSSGIVRLTISDPFKATISKGVRSITANKATDDTKLGFSYKVVGGTITIEIVKEEGIFGNTELKPGQQIIRINGISVEDMDRNAFKVFLGELTAGDVTIDVFDETFKAVDAAAPEEPKVEEEMVVEPETLAAATKEVVMEETQQEVSEPQLVEEVVAEDEGAPEVESGLSPEEEAHLEQVKSEVRQLVDQTNPPMSADYMLAQYEGREDELLSHLKQFAESTGRQ